MELFFEHLKHNINNNYESRRLFHGRGKILPEFDYINIDYFNPYINLIFYREPENEFLDCLIKVLSSELSSNLLGINFQKRFLKEAPSEVVYGNVPAEFHANIEGLKYSIKIGATQNVGFFLDMEKGRSFLKQTSKDKKILNLFSYTCALSVVALKNDALSVINFDMSKAALKRGEYNHKLNEINLSKAKFFDHDIFKSFGKIKKEGLFDLIIIDPPSDHGDHFKIERDYPKLIKRLGEWMNNECIVMTCLNSPHYDFNFLKTLVEENTDLLKYNSQMGAPDTFEEKNLDSGLKIIIWDKV